MFNFKHTYAQQPADFFSCVAPTPVASPSLLLFNLALAQDLGIDTRNETHESLAQLFSGNQLTESCYPIAQAYAGHQFGHFTLLGDGRAHILGEQLTPEGTIFDIQLKGSGPTPYSRRGDGRATVKAMLREYLMSEAMHSLGIPTSRSLAVVATGEMVHREPVQPGAILTRVMSSHIRVGTFEFAKRFLGSESVKALSTYVIDRHYPELKSTEYPGIPILNAVMQRQLTLVIHWMRVGFIHGVMNTDNVSIPGETFDYGPCAFMNAYHPETVFSSIDSQGRYAFGNQPSIVQWNLSVLAGALLPLMGEDQEKNVEEAKALLTTFPEQYHTRWVQMMGEKLGFKRLLAVDRSIVDRLLKWMEDNGVDYTNTFRDLTINDFKDDWYANDNFVQWKNDWRELLNAYAMNAEESTDIMTCVNPMVIPRNHNVERVLTSAERGDMTPFLELLEVLQQPYQFSDSLNSFSQPPQDGDEGYQTFCGT